MNPQISQITQKEHERDPRTYAIIGAAMEVHRQLGCGFPETVYQEALALELTIHRVPHPREVELPVLYKGHRLNTTYRADFICFDSVIVEIKAIAKLSGAERGSNYQLPQGDWLQGWSASEFRF
jgi:GxxExxY protein